MARSDITPPVGIYHRMWGAAVRDRSEGVHRPLTATALVFAPANSAASSADIQVLVAIDHCLLGAEEVADLLTQVADAAGTTRDAIMISFSHTHAAGLLNRDRQALPGGDLIPEYLARLGEILAQLTADARSHLDEVTVQYATGRCSLAANRDFLDPSTHEWVCGYNPDGPSDDTVCVARFTDRSERLVATCVNYGCHPTTLAWDNRLISPDYPGAMREVVEQATHAPCVFLQGASGDLGPIDGYVKDVGVADRNGRQLGYAALEALESIPPPRTEHAYAGAVTSGATLGTWQYIPLDEQQRSRAAVWRANREPVRLPFRQDLPTPAQAEVQLRQLSSQEHTAHEAGDESSARRFRALAERQRRMLGRLKGLPDGSTFIYEACLWRIGDAVWLALPGEPYHLLQTELRTRFQNTPLMIATIANGWGPSYLPTRETYGKGIYQETIAALEAGSLETLIEHLADKINNLLQAEHK